MQDCLLQAFRETDKADTGHLPQQDCIRAVNSLVVDMLHLTSQASFA